MISGLESSEHIWHREVPTPIIIRVCAVTVQIYMWALVSHNVFRLAIAMNHMMEHASAVGQESWERDQ